MFPPVGEFNELRHDVAKIKQDIHALKVALAVVSQDIASWCLAGLKSLGTMTYIDKS